MGQASADHPNVGALLRDRATGRLGVYMGTAGPYAMLRPVGGGKEWQARPGDLQPEVSAYPRPADVVQLHAASRLHVDECGACTADAAVCDIGRALILACLEAMRPARFASPAEAS